MAIVDATDNILSNVNAEIVTPTYTTSPVSAINDTTPRVYTRQLLSGNLRGNQNITGAIIITDPNTNQQNISIDGSAQAITVTNTDGSVVGMGLIPSTTDFGFYAQDSNGNLLYKIVGSTIYAYDITQTPVTNIIQILKLPDNTYGMAIAKTGKNVADAFS